MKRTLVVLSEPYPVPQSSPDSSEAVPFCAASFERVAEAALRDTLAAAEALSLGPGREPPHLVLAYSGDRSWYQRRASSHWLLLPRMGSTIEQHLDNLLISLGVQPEQQTIFLSPRTPHLRMRQLQHAYLSLDQRQVVVGPCEGSGLYLLGVSGRWPCGLLNGTRWQTGHVEADLLKAFKRASLTARVLDELYELRHDSDLQRLAQDLGLLPDWALPNLRFLLNHLDEVEEEPA
ncbi:MAG: DUF2064 domain-containing protein [Bacteroidota bacterium]